MGENLYYLTFADGTKIGIEERSGINDIKHVAEDEEAALNVCALLTKENLSHVEFSSKTGGVFGVYDGLVLNSQPIRQTMPESGKVLVSFSLRQQTSLEKRLSALEKSGAEFQANFTDLELAVAEMYELMMGGSSNG